MIPWRAQGKNAVEQHEVMYEDFGAGSGAGGPF